VDSSETGDVEENVTVGNDEEEFRKYIGSLASIMPLLSPNKSPSKKKNKR